MSAAFDLPLLRSDRPAWIERVQRLCHTPLEACIHGTVKRETSLRSPADRADYAPLELLGRVAAGMGPWLGCTVVVDVLESECRARLRNSLLAALVSATSVDCAHRFNFTRGDQPLVDAAWLAVGLFRAGPSLWDCLDRREQERVCIALEDVLVIRPWHNNWLLFTAVIEAFLACRGRRYRPAAIRRALQCFEQWFCGDGIYSDGVSIGVDYYNGSTIHPLLLTLVELDGGSGQFVSRRLQRLIMDRAQRHAETLERLIGDDGAFPPLGRSITYRCGAFHLLAQLAWRGCLPQSLPASRVRGCLSAVIQWTLDAENTFDERGWLRVGLRGFQPDLADHYTSAGSGYFCMTAFLPLGLSPDDPFWAEPVLHWSAKLLQHGDSPGPDRKAPKRMTSWQQFSSNLRPVHRRLPLSGLWSRFMGGN